MPADQANFADRRKRAAALLRERGIAALLLSPASDLTYLAGYRVHSTERLTWDETDDPYALVASLVGGRGDVAVADQMWALFSIRLQEALGGRSITLASAVTRELRMRKDVPELAALAAVSAAADRAYMKMRDRAFSGRRERDVAADLAMLLREEGHDEVAFTIVASGSNGASPHHATGERTIQDGDTVVLDFGGTREWYCSDITRTVHIGTPDGETVRVHDSVRRAQEAGYAAAIAGATCESVDAAARRVIDEAGYGRFFIHRTGHGIGLDGHEHPYLVSGNTERLEPGMAFSIEPGIYLPGRFGVRIEDIAIIGDDGRAVPLNAADHSLAAVR